ncbi:wax ester/triacylglycerol synthase domain-containing protein [Streptomyces sp. I05A-00742]|uniref:wax ester/triacylglycerol synthase domain-containing protein n=1 Tax=Streptomyces sp. I05A-00742 TaxID=2732853 RepID=UPI0014886CDE|nr:wax ester/triacylglycerol synthase domain-containing protein [Streptomyces sp. I05A-00742]
MLVLPMNRDHGPVSFGPSDRYQYLRARSVPDPARTHVCIAARMTGPPPTRDELELLVADMVARVPALGYRVAGRGRRARFEPAGRLDVSRHVEEIEVPAGRSADRCALDALESPLAPGRPLWGVRLIRGYSEDEFLLTYRAAHLFQDGLAVARAMGAALSGARLPPPAPRPATAPSSPVGLRSCVRFLPHLFGRTARWLPPGTTMTGKRTLHTVTLDRAAFDDITRRTGATAAQIGLAALAGALRAWTPEHWSGTGGRRQRRGLRAYLPISLRHPGDRAALGSSVGIMPLTLPCAEPSPVRRLEDVVRDTGPMTLYRFRELFGRLLRAPGPVAWLVHRVVHHWAPARPGVTVIPADLHDSAPGVAGLIPVSPPVGPSPGGCVFVLERTRVSASFLFDSGVPGTDRLPGLLDAALAELRAAVAAVRPD